MQGEFNWQGLIYFLLLTYFVWKILQCFKQRKNVPFHTILILGFFVFGPRLEWWNQLRSIIGLGVMVILDRLVPPLFFPPIGKNSSGPYPRDFLNVVDLPSKLTTIASERVEFRCPHDWISFDPQNRAEGTVEQIGMRPPNSPNPCCYIMVNSTPYSTATTEQLATHLNGIIYRQNGLIAKMGFLTFAKSTPAIWVDYNDHHRLYRVVCFVRENREYVLMFCGSVLYFQNSLGQFDIFLKDFKVKGNKFTSLDWHQAI